MIKCDVKYHDMEMPRLKLDPRGDWIDVRASAVEVDGEQWAWHPTLAQPYELDVITWQPRQSVLIRLGFSMAFPPKYEAHVIPRSSLFKKTGLILTNSMGLIDHTYCGNGDEWLFPAYALRAGKVERYQRIAQFRLVERMSRVEFQEVTALGGQDRGGGPRQFVPSRHRGGYGSTDQNPLTELDEALSNSQY